MENGSYTTSVINRSDDTISGLNSELLIDNKWVRFQTDRGATCGNSNWKQKLSNKQSLYINFDFRYSDGIKVPFRMSYSHDGKVIKSNKIQIKLPKDVYEYVMH
jgi:hypothetical protein